MTVTVLRMRPWHIHALVRTFVLGARSCISVVGFEGLSALALRALLYAIPGLIQGKRAYGAWMEGQLVGFLLVECPAKSRRVRVLGVAMVDKPLNKDQDSNDVSRAKAICETLLKRLSEVAAQDGFISLFVRLPIDSPFFEIFQRRGFVGAVREDVYVRHPRPMGVPQVAEGLRAREAADAWDVSQLYRAVTPAAVQLADFPDDKLAGGFQDHIFGSWLAGRPREFVVESSEGSGIDAWVRITAAHHGCHAISLMLHPRNSSSASSLIRFALWRLAQCASIPTRIMVRSHDDVLLRAVEFEGFNLTDTCELMVHQMAVRVHAGAPAHAFDRVTS